MTDVQRWGVLTVGTGLGNARFTNRTDERGSLHSASGARASGRAHDHDAGQRPAAPMIDMNQSSIAPFSSRG